MDFVCSTTPEPSNEEGLPPGVVPTKLAAMGTFELRATQPVDLGMIRVAVANNCTTGQNAEYCGPTHRARDQSEYTALLRKHADVYPTGKVGEGAAQGERPRGRDACVRAFGRV